MTDSRPSTNVSYVRFVALAVVLCAGAMLIGYWPTVRLGGHEAVYGMFAGCGISLAASLLGAIPILAARRGLSTTILQAVLLSTLVRFIVVMMLALSAALSGWFERAPLLVWVALSYLVLLVADTLFAVRPGVSDWTPEK